MGFHDAKITIFKDYITFDVKIRNLLLKYKLRFLSSKE
jgi:hypothetical protein